MTTKINRRSLFFGAGSALAALFVRRAVAAGGEGRIPPAPVARIAIVKDTYFGETVSDPYRWMENDKDSDWLPFLKGQNDHARAVLGRIPGRERLLARIQQLSGDTAATRRVQRAGGKLFFEQRPLGADNFKLFVQEGGVNRVLIDPTALSSKTSHQSLDWWRASPDGSHLVYGLSKDGSEDSILHVLKVADGVDLPERILNTQAAGPQWLDDGSGFFYNQLTGAVDTPERFLDSQARFHRLHTDPSSDPILMKRGKDPAVRYERIQAPYIQTCPGSKYALLGLADVRSEQRILIAPIANILANEAHWTAVADFADEVTGADIVGDTIYLLANKGHPRGRIVKTSVTTPSVATAAEVVPEGKAVIVSFERAQNGLYLQMMDGGIYRLEHLGYDGRVSDITLPFEGTISALATDSKESGALFSLSGWLNPADIWSVDAQGRVAATGLTPKPGIDVSGYEAKRFFATARDGTQIPYSLIYKKGLKLDGSNPTWISAYGSYGANAYTP
jgi:prolyl oligopeptidase